MAIENAAATPAENGETFTLHPAVLWARCVALFPGWLREVRGGLRAALREEKGLSARRRNILKQRIRDLDGMVRMLERCEAYRERFGSSPVKAYTVALKEEAGLEDLPGYRAVMDRLERGEARKSIAASSDRPESAVEKVDVNLLVVDGAVVGYQASEGGKWATRAALGF
jgi:hypothetical protein